MKAVSIVLSALVLTGLSATFIAQMPEPESPPVVVVEVIDPLEQARQASFDIDMPEGAGSAVLVARSNLGDGSYRYKALTAHHVITEIVADPENKSCTFTFQPDFHGPHLRIIAEIDIGWTVPSDDWASFQFTATELLECAEVATREEFEAINAFDPIYFVASYGPFGPQCRKGIIATTHNVGVYAEAQKISDLPWNQRPENFFRFTMHIWYGDSGGPIFTEHGKLIGMGNAFTVGGGFKQNVTHSGVAIKAHVIRETVVDTKDFFKIED